MMFMAEKYSNHPICSVSATFQVNLSVTTRLSSAQYFTVGVNGHLVP